MANVTAIDLGANAYRIEVFLPEGEYKQRADKDLNKYAQKAQVRGFRPGKTPKKLVKSMYGDNFTVESVNKLISEAVNNYITENKLNLIADPIAMEQQDAVVFGNKENKDITFSFCVALRKYLTLTDEDIKLADRYCIKVMPERIQEVISGLRDRFGEQQTVEAPESEIAFKDLLDVTITSAEGDLIGDAIIISPQDCTETFKDELLKAHVGNTLTAKVSDLDTKEETEFVVKNIFGKEPDFVVPQTINILIKSLKRIIPADLNDTLFQKIAAETKTEISSESDLAVFVEQNIRKGYYFEENLLYAEELIQKIQEKYDPEFPEQYFRLFIKNRTKDISEEGIDAFIQSYTDFFKRSNVIDSIMIHLALEITPQDIYKVFLRIFNSKLGFPPDFEYQSYHRDAFMNAQKENNADYQHYEQTAQKNKFAQFVFDEDKVNCIFVDKEIFNERFKTYYQAPENEMPVEELENPDYAEFEQAEEHQHAHDENAITPHEEIN